MRPSLDFAGGPAISAGRHHSEAALGERRARIGADLLVDASWRSRTRNRGVVAFRSVVGRIYLGVETTFGASVLPSISTYSRRAVPGQPAVPRSGPPVAETLVPCAVDAIAVINAERRLLLPPTMGGNGVAMRALDAAIELRSTVEGERTTRPDHRRRLRIPPGILRAAGLCAGMRVALLRTGPDRWEVVDVRRLGLRRSA